MDRKIVLLGVATAMAASSSAYAAKKCNVKGSWLDSYSITFVMTSLKTGTIAMNPECGNEVGKITTTALSSTAWDLKVTSKKCPTVITADYTFDPGSCTSASGTITIPGVGMLPDSITKQ